MLIKDFYQAQSKKQKSKILQAILIHPAFKKSKEWLRKYLGGAYLKLDENTEKIGAEILLQTKNDGSPSFPFRSIEKIEENLNLIQKEKANFPLWGLKRDYFEQIIKRNIDSKSNSKTGIAWIRFGRKCTKDLHKINPFQVMTELVSDWIFEKNRMIDKELIELYEGFLNSNNHFEYLAAWERFGLRARIIHFLNPFRAILFIIKL